MLFFDLNKLKLLDMRKLYFTLTLFVLSIVTSYAQSAGMIWQPSQDGPYYDYEIEQGKPKEFYDAGGPKGNMLENYMYTLCRLKPRNSDSHITIVFEKVEFDKIDELRIYDGLVTLFNGPDEDGEYHYSWPKDIQPNTTIKAENAGKPIVVSSKAPNGELSVAFYCNSNMPGWKAMIYCVKNGDKEPTVETPEATPNFTFQIDPTAKGKYDEEEEEYLPLNLTLNMQGVKDGQSVEIDNNGEKQVYNVRKEMVGSVTLEVEAGKVIKVYGDLSIFRAQSNNLVSFTLGKNDNLKVLDVTMNKITSLNLTNLPKLKELWVSGNKLTAIDLSNLGNLEEFYGSYNKVGQLRTNMNPKLDVLSVEGMDLTELDLTKNPNLLILRAGHNKFEGLPNLSENTKLQTLDMENSNLSNIDIAPFLDLKKLDLSGNKITSIDISKNKNIRSIDLDQNQLDACAINDILFTLPQAEKAEEANIRLYGNTGSTTFDPSLITNKNWATNVTGDNTGCNTVRLRFEENANGTLRTTVEGNTIAEWTPIQKGKEVKVEATPMKGYKLVKTMLNGEEIANSTFKANQYGLLAALYTVDNGISNVEIGSMQTVKHNGKIIIQGLQAEQLYRIYNTAGVLIATGTTDADGEATIEMQTKGIIIVRQGDVAIKLWN